MKEIKNSMIIAGTFIATIIGAGFASGQEILSYFVIYGKNSVFALFGVCILFSLCSICIMLRTQKLSAFTFDDYIRSIAGKKSAAFIRICVFLFMFVSFCSMTAGSGELFSSSFYFPKTVGICSMLIPCIIIFIFDIRGILAINSVLAPILSIALFFFAVHSFIYRGTEVFSANIITNLCQNTTTSALIYASYNILTSVVILSESSSLISSKRMCFISSFSGGMTLFAIAVSIWASLSLYYAKIPLGQMPFLDIVSRGGSFFSLSYSVIVYLSMLTTAISCGHGVISIMREKIKIKRLSAIAVLIALSLPVICLGFESIIKNIYSIFGYMGIILIVLILSDGIRLITEKN